MAPDLQRFGEIQRRKRMGVSIRYIVAFSAFSLAALGYALL